MDEEKDLIFQAKKGSIQAFSKLVEKNKEKIFFAALRLTGNLHEAEDIAGETFFIAFKNISQFKGNSAFSTWLYRICFSIVYHKQKRKKLIRFFSSFDESKEYDVPVSSEVEDELVKEERQRIVRKCIGKLPSKMRDMILLREFEGLSYRELARVFNCSIGTVMSKLYRARKKLKELLIKEGFKF